MGGESVGDDEQGLCFKTQWQFANLRTMTVARKGSMSVYFLLRFLMTTFYYHSYEYFEHLRNRNRPFVLIRKNVRQICFDARLLTKKNRERLGYLLKFVSKYIHLFHFKLVVFGASLLFCDNIKSNMIFVFDCKFVYDNCVRSTNH